VPKRLDIEKITEVSLCDAGANNGLSRVLIRKRLDDNQTEGTMSGLNEVLDALALEIKKFDPKMTKEMAAATAFEQLDPRLRELAKAQGRLHNGGSLAEVRFHESIIKAASKGDAPRREQPSDVDETDAKRNKKPKKTAMQKLEKLARKIKERSESPLTEARALTKALEQRPDLYVRDRQERGIVA
jgi:hypothetical protein